MLRRMLRVWGGGGQNPPDDRMGDPISVHSNCCGLGCRERESSEDVVGKAANKHAAVVAIFLLGDRCAGGKYLPVARKWCPMACPMVVA